jgi:hypothetical protein
MADVEYKKVPACLLECAIFDRFCPDPTDNEFQNARTVTVDDDIREKRYSLRKSGPPE